MEPLVRYVDIELHRPITEYFAAIDRIATRIDDAGSRVDATRVYRVGSRFGYRMWGAWAVVRTFPLVISVAPSPRDSPTAVQVRLASNEGWGLYRLPAFFRQADRAFIRWIDRLRSAADAATVTELSPVELSRDLHEARLDLQSLVVSDGVLSISGRAPKRALRREWSGRHFLLRISDVESFVLDDQAGLRFLDLHEVEKTPDWLIIVGHVPCEIRIVAGSPRLTVAID